MSLSTRIAIRPSRVLAFVEAGMIAGAIIATAVTAAARLVPASEPAALWLTACAAALLGAALAMRRWIKRVGSCAHEAFLDERAGVSMRRLGEEAMPRALRLTEATVVWPGFAVLSLSSSSTPGPAFRAGSGRRAFEIPVVRAEMDAHDAWRLHRFLLWAERDGAPTIDATRTDFPG